MSKEKDPVDDLAEKVDTIRSDFHEGFKISGCVLAYKDKNDKDDDKFYMIRKDKEDITYVSELPEACNKYVTESMENMGKVYDSLNDVVSSAKYVSTICAIVRADVILAIYSGIISLLSFVVAIYLIVVNRGSYNIKNILMIIGLMLIHICLGGIKWYCNKQVKAYTSGVSNEEIKEFIDNK